MPKKVKDICGNPIQPIVPLRKLDMIFRRRNLPNTQYYFTDREHAAGKYRPKRQFNLPRGELILYNVKYRERMVKDLRKNTREQPALKKDNFRWYASKTLSQRLYVEQPPHNVKTVVAIHPEFYKVVEGRPIRSYDDIKVYISNIRNFSTYRQQIAYRNDMSLNIETNQNKELKEYNAINDHLHLITKNFQAFLTEDYKKANAKVAKAEQIYEELLLKRNELLGFQTQEVNLRNDILNLDTIRIILGTYRTFLMHTAPDSWREKYDEKFKRLSLFVMENQSEDVFSDKGLFFMGIFNSLRFTKSELEQEKPAYIYHKNPQQMLKLFRRMEFQCREQLHKTAQTCKVRIVLENEIKRLKAIIKEIVELYNYFLDSVSKEMERELFNESYIKEKFSRIMEETFFDLVASPTALKLKICVEFVYGKIFGLTKVTHPNLADPVRILELFFHDYNIRLDSMDYNIVKKAKYQSYSKDLKALEAAKHAQRVLREFEDVSKALQKAFQPPAKFKRPDYKKSINKKVPVETQKLERNKYNISSEDLENLTLFTDWCYDKDPKPYLEQLEKYVKPFLVPSES